MRSVNFRKALRSGYRKFSLEELADGVSRVEIEHVFYGIMPSLDILQAAASVEFHEQWQFKIDKTDKNAGSGNVRVRKTTFENGEVEYVQTTKTKIIDNPDGVLETSMLVSESVFKQFIILADQGMRKHRYSFPVTGGLVYELDLFLKPGTVDSDRQYYDWCKVDLEVPNKETFTPPMPFHLHGMIADIGKDLDPELREKITNIYSDCFLSKNPLLLTQ